MGGETSLFKAQTHYEYSHVCGHLQQLPQSINKNNKQRCQKTKKKIKKRAAQTTQEWTKATMAGKQKIN